MGCLLHTTDMAISSFRPSLHTIVGAFRELLAPALAMGLLCLFVFAVGWREFLAALDGAHLGVYALAFASTCVCLVARSLVWRRVLAVVDGVRSVSFVLGLFVLATFCKYVTPYGQVAAGPGIAAIVSRRGDIRYETALATTVSADFLNYVPYYTLGGLALGSLLVGTAIPGARYVAIALGVVVVAVVVLAVSVWRYRNGVERLLLLASRPVRRVVAAVSTRHAGLVSRAQLRERLDGFYRTLDLVARDRRGVVVALAYAHLGWVFLAAPLAITAAAFGAVLPLGVAFAVVAVGKLGSVVPVPGGVGGVEVVIAGSLVLVAGVGSASAAAIAICYRFSVYWFPLFLGGLTSLYYSLS